MIYISKHWSEAWSLPEALSFSLFLSLALSLSQKLQNSIHSFNDWLVTRVTMVEFWTFSYVQKEAFRPKCSSA